MHMHVRLCTHDVRTQIVTPSASTYPPTTHQLEEAATEVARFRSESMRCQAEINISILFTFNWNNSSIKSDLPLPTYCLPTVYLPTYSRTYQAENDALRSELKAAQARHVRHAACGVRHNLRLVPFHPPNQPPAYEARHVAATSPRAPWHHHHGYTYCLLVLTNCTYCLFVLVLTRRGMRRRARHPRQGWHRRRTRRHGSRRR